jgi:hypothetical protein
MVRFNLFDFWFRPKPFESERFYKRLGALVIKRYVPTVVTSSCVVYATTTRAADG